MTPTQATDFVELVIAAWPHTRTEDKTADVWYLAGLNDVTWEDGTEAIRNLLKTHTFVSLAEILTEVRRIRDQRAAPHPTPRPPGHPDDEAAYRAFAREAAKRLGDGDGATKLAAIGSGTPPTPEYDQARGIYRDPIRIAAKKVRCPWPACSAAIGSSCTTSTGRPLTDQPCHDARLDALVGAGLADWVEIDGVRRLALRKTA